MSRRSIDNLNGVSSKCRWFGIKGLTEDIDEVDIRQGLQSIGSVKFVDILDSALVNVCIELRDDINKESENNEVKIFIEGEYFQLKEVNFPLFKIQDDFSNFIKNQLFSSILFIRSKKESEKSITFFNELYLKTELVIKDLTGKVSGIKRVIVIGSRATGLAEPDSLLDLYVEIGDSYFKNEWDESELCNQLKEVEVELKKLNHGQHLVFKNIKINGSTIEAIHWLTQMKCKIFCGNGLVVEKSKLIGLYVNSDDRVKRLILIIKEWAKYTHLPDDISNYSLTWIVLYYLIKVLLLKPVSALKNNVAKQKKISFRLGMWI